MSIIFITGIPGGGKSYVALKNYIIPCMKDTESKRNIVTNITGLNINIIAYYYDLNPYDLEARVYQIDKDQFYTLDNDLMRGVYGNNPLIVIDEVQTLHQTGRDSSMTQAFSDFLTQHRKYGIFHYICITQEMAKCHLTYRQLYDVNILVKNLGFLGMRLAYLEQAFIRNSKESFQKKFGRYDKNLFKMYNSFLVENPDIAKVNTHRLKFFNFTRTIILVLCLFAVVNFYVHMFKNNKKEVKANVEDNNIAVNSKANVAPVQSYQLKREVIQTQARNLKTPARIEHCSTLTYKGFNLYTAQLYIEKDSNSISIIIDYCRPTGSIIELSDLQIRQGIVKYEMMREMGWINYIRLYNRTT